MVRKFITVFSLLRITLTDCKASQFELGAAVAFALPFDGVGMVKKGLEVVVRRVEATNFADGG